MVRSRRGTRDILTVAVLLSAGVAVFCRCTWHSSEDFVGLRPWVQTSRGSGGRSIVQAYDEERRFKTSDLRTEVDDFGGQARFYLFGAFAVSGGIGLFFIVPRLLAILIGVQPAEYLDGSLQDLAINLSAALGFGFLFKQELDGQERRKRRRAEGGLIASANVQMAEGGKQMALANLRFGRSAEPRLPMLCIGPRNFCLECLESSKSYSEQIESADFLLVPVLTAKGSSDPAATLADVKATAKGLSYVAFPDEPAENWQELQQIQADEVEFQGLDGSDGIVLVVKKNGRVGGRFLGVPDWKAFTGQVEARAAAGLDTQRI